MVFNRLANKFLQLLFGLKLNDTTNAFKAYRRTVIEGCRPYLAPHFNLTVEIPLKAIVRRGDLTGLYVLDAQNRPIVAEVPPVPAPPRPSATR